MIRRLLLLIALLLCSQAAFALTVNFSSPTQTNYIHSASVTVSARAFAIKDGEWVISLKLYRSGVLLASGDDRASASVSNLPPGTYHFTATGTNNWGQSVSKTLTVTVNPSKVIGNIDGLSNDANGTPYVVGWACSTGLNQSIDVHTYLGGAWPSGTNTDGRTANLSSEPAVASACQATGTAYRFSIPISLFDRQQHAGKAIYIHGISPVGQPNDLIGQSGVFTVPPPPNQAPAVQLTAPAAGGQGIASATIRLAANASDSDDGVASVAFYANGSLLHTDTAAPYEFSWSGVAAGSYNLQAIAKDTRGASTTSATVAVSVAASRVIGSFDSIPVDSTGGASLYGWACSTGLSQSIDVHVYVGGPAGSGAYLTAARAGNPSEAAVASACQATGTTYRFSIALTNAMREQHAGKPIYIHGISPVGQPNNLISGSGGHAVPAPTKIATFIAQTMPTTMVAGQSYAASVQFRNDGTAVWRASESYRLGSINPVSNTTWGPNRVELVGDVGYGGIANFDFTAKAPATAGTYNFQWQLVQDGVTWIPSAAPNQQIRVVTGSLSASPNPCVFPQGQTTCTATVSWSSSAADAEVWRTDANNANPQLVLRAQSGNQGATIGSTVSRFHLKAGGVTIATVDVTGVSNPPPTVQLTAPVAGLHGTAPAAMLLKADATDADGVASVSFYANGALLGTDTVAPYEVSWTGVAAGTYNVHAVATDNRNAVAQTAPVAVTVNAAPSVQLTAPAAGAQGTAPVAIVIRANAADSDDGVASVAFYANGTLLATDTAAPFEYTWSGVGAGSYSLHAVAKDTRNASATSPAVSVSVVANALPTVTLTSPGAGNNGIAPATVAVSANAADADDGVASVSFYANGTLLSTDTVAPYAFTWSNVAAGNYNVTAVARDTRGATASTAPVAISIVAPVSNPSSSTRYYLYDQHQQLCKVVEPETRATVMDYDPAGNLAWSASGLELTGTAPGQCDRTDASVAARQVSRSYDARNRLVTLRFPDGRGNQDWTYTATGQPATIKTSNDGAGQTLVTNSYTYNRRGLLVGESSGQPNWYSWGVGYGYDPNGNLASQSYPTGATVTYAPNALGQPTQAVASFGVLASGVQYHPNGSIRQFTYGNGVVHAMQQNARQLPLRVTSSGGVLDYEYGFDANGNVGHIYDHARGSGFSRWMGYDGLDRLTAAGSAMFGGDHWHRFTYDKLDNLTSWKLPGVKDYAEYYYDPGTHRLISLRNSLGSTVVGLDYDVQGNLRNKNGVEHRFDYGNRLREVAGKETYRYDGHGRRVSTTIGLENPRYRKSLYSQSGQLLFEESTGSTTRTEHMYLAGSLIASRSTDYTAIRGQPQMTYTHTDALGSPVAKTDATGQVVDRTVYEPYGAAIGGSKQGIGYTGHVMDVATGLTYMQQRYYDPESGRFLSVDPVSADTVTGWNFNRYNYAANNPYKFTDPDGRMIMSSAERQSPSCQSNPHCAFGLQAGGGSRRGGATGGRRGRNEARSTSEARDLAEGAGLRSEISRLEPGREQPQFVGAPGSAPYNSVTNRVLRQELGSIQRGRLELIQRSVQNGELNMSNTVAQQREGQRGFIPTTAIVETISGGARRPDPRGVAGHHMYTSPVSFSRNGQSSSGTLEVLVHEPSGQVRHVLYRSGE